MRHGYAGRAPGRTRSWTRNSTVVQAIGAFAVFGLLAVVLSSWRVDIWSRGRGTLQASGKDPRILTHLANIQKRSRSSGNATPGAFAGRGDFHREGFAVLDTAALSSARAWAGAVCCDPGMCNASNGAQRGIAVH
jgi:hypothetical protein